MFTKIFLFSHLTTTNYKHVPQCLIIDWQPRSNLDRTSQDTNFLQLDFNKNTYSVTNTTYLVHTKNKLSPSPNSFLPILNATTTTKSPSAPSTFFTLVTTMFLAFKKWKAHKYVYSLRVIWAIQDHYFEFWTHWRFNFMIVLLMIFKWVKRV